MTTSTLADRDVIPMSQVVELADPKLEAIGQHVLRILQMEAEKAVAHHAAPAAFPLEPATSSLAVGAEPSTEELFLSWFQRLDPRKQQAATARVMASINAAQPQREASYGELAKVNLRSAASVARQAAALGCPARLRFPLDYLRRLTHLHGQILVPHPLPESTEDSELPVESILPSQQNASLTTNKLELRDPQGQMPR